MRDFEETVDFDVEVKMLRDKAMLVIVEGEDEVWFPYSQISPNSDIDKDSAPGDIGTITVSEWIAIEKELV
jgi:hypothetical protein